MKTTITAERELDAPADVLYHLLADYRTHHRPEGFLPPAFTDLEVLAGGVGAGTEATWNVDTGSVRRSVHALITEPAPGHTLLETADGLVTTFTVDPTAAGARVRFVTVIDEPGVRGVLTRLFAPRMLAPLYADELQRLGEHARAHGPVAA
jgi:hypothetical protein